MPRFLGLKSYLTTNRSSIVKQDATRLRRSRLSKVEILREDIAERLKCPLCFCLPCFVAVSVMFVFIVVYVTIPYTRGLNYEMTQCRVEKVELSQKGACSLNTETFTPCYKITVKYNTTSEVKVSVLMENEQTLFHCEKCSFTFGKGSLFTKNKCTNPRACLETYHKKYGTINDKYSCFYDPANPQNVFREHKISRTEAVYQTTLPVVFVFLFILSFVFVQYDDLKRRKLNKEIKFQTHRRTVGTHRHKPDIPSCSTDSGTSESPSSSGSTAAMYRVRKKKMPCTKTHVLSTRDDEDVIMEEKPISPNHVTHSNVFMQVNVEKLKTHCACANHASLGNNFELSREQERFKPVMPSEHYYQNQLQRSRRAFRYLPESVV